MPIQRCSTPEETATAVANLRSSRTTGLFLFFGSEDPVSGESWCPDCVTADPVLRAAVTRLRPELTLYECPVGVRSQWKNRPEHPYRQDPTARLARIPTLLMVVDGCERGRLVEADCAKPELVAAFLAP
jgi:hypothetical protein